MCRIKILVVALAAACMLLEVAAPAAAWEDIGRGRARFRAVLVDINLPARIYAGYDNAVIESKDSGASWEVIFSLRGAGQIVNSLSGKGEELYAATSAGLWRKLKNGNRWEQIFKSGNESENNCAAVIALPDCLCVGTNKGLLVSRDNARTWQRASGELGTSAIYALGSDLKDAKYIYAASDLGVFRSADYAISWEKTYNSLQRPEEQYEESSENKPEEALDSNIKYLCVNPAKAGQLFLATSRGVVMSIDRGESWQALSDYGLLSKDVALVLAADNGVLYCATSSGVFSWDNGRWKEISFALPAGKIKAIDFDHNYFYAATEKGLFRDKLNEEPGRNKAGLNKYLGGIPDIQDVQRKAMRYAEVELEKIKNWRRQAACKAILPRLSTSINRDTGDLWHWEGGSTTKVGDDVLMRGRDTIGWDVTLTWDLSDLVFNDAQTSIDVRSRLMVEYMNWNISTIAI